MNTRKLMIARVILTVLTVAAVAAIFYNSSLSAVESTEQSFPLTEWINSVLNSLRVPLVVNEAFVRKLAHFAEYAALGTLLSVTVYLYTPKCNRTLLTALPMGASVAVCDELIQLFSQGRSCEVRDMLIDFCGVLCTALLAVFIISNIEKRNKKVYEEANEGRVTLE